MCFVNQYADPVIDRLDKYKVVRKRLFREHCRERKGLFVKDLRYFKRPLNEVIIVDVI